MNRPISTYLTAAVLLLTLRLPAYACSACYGESDSPMAQGMNAGIIALLVIVGGVLGGVAAFFIYLVRRNRRMSNRTALLDDPALLGLKPLNLTGASTTQMLPSSESR